MNKSSLKEKLISQQDTSDAVLVQSELKILNDELFGLKNINENKKNEIVYLSIEKLIPYSSQRFRLYEKDQLNELAEDIRINGVLSPVLVRPHKEKIGFYEILAGRNRTNACKLCGKTEVPCIVLNVDDAKAKLVVANTNLNQRRNLLPSEEAYGYKMQLEGLEQLGTNCPSVSKIAEENNTNRKHIYRYIKLTELIDGILDMVDDEVIPVIAGWNISFCTVEEQRILLEFINYYDVKNISLNQSKIIRSLHDIDDFTSENLEKILFKPKKEKVRTIKIQSERLIELIPCEVDIEDYIVTALEYYQSERGAAYQSQ